MIKEYQHSRMYSCQVRYQDGWCDGLALLENHVYTCPACEASWTTTGDQLTPPLKERTTPCTT